MRVFTVLLAAFMALLFTVGWRTNAFVRLPVREDAIGASIFTYREVARRNLIHVSAVSTSMDSLLQARRFTSRKSLDVFIPGSGAEVGFVVYAADADQLGLLKDVARVRTIPPQRVLSTSFPLRNPLASIVGYLAATRAFARYRGRHGYGNAVIMALVDGDRIIYMEPIAH